VLFARHLADSLLFASAWDHRKAPPSSLLDVGSGVGLPGLPLAIAWPECEITLLDRSTRRADLARRAVRILGLTNVRVARAQLQEWKEPANMIVCRAVGSPNSLRGDVIRLLGSTGTAVIGGSHKARPQIDGYQVRQVPIGVIGYPVWLLIIRSQ
jgi:16S rRNA (guanine527-N7)-methyltransferase